MQTLDAAIAAVLGARTRDLVDVVEVYDHFYTPSASGFDPSQALLRLAPVAGITWSSQTYRRTTTGRGDVDRSMGPNFNGVSIKLSNVDRYIATFVLTHDLEGMRLVVRTISKAQPASSTASVVLFAGRVDRATSIDKKQCTWTAKQDLATIQHVLPWRSIDHNCPLEFKSADCLGDELLTAKSAEYQAATKCDKARDGDCARFNNTKYFQGFRFVPVPGTFPMPTQVTKSYLWGLIKRKKTVYTDGQFSSEDLTPYGQKVPFALGRVKALGKPLERVDTGSGVRFSDLFSEGPIDAITDIKNLEPSLLQPGADGITIHLGEYGGVGSQVHSFQFPNSDLYSRTAYATGYCSGGSLTERDADPITSAVLRGMLVPLPNAAGVFDHVFTASASTDTLTAAAHGLTNGARVLLRTTSALPAPLSSGRIYYVRDAATNSLKLAATAGGAAIDLTDAGTGAHTLGMIGWTDNPAYLTRYVLTEPRLFNIPAAMIDDGVCFDTGKWCDEPLIDDSNGERIFVPTNQVANIGSGEGQQRRFRTTGLIDSVFYRVLLGLDATPAEFADPTIEDFDPADPPDLIAPVRYLRRRYTANTLLDEETKAVDFLFKVLLPAFRGFITIGANGKLQIKSERPADNAFIRSDASTSAASVAVDDVEPWRASAAGEIVLGVGSPTGELRKVTGATYSLAGNAVTLAATASGALTATASGATLSGGTESAPAEGTITLGGTPAAGAQVTATVDGVEAAYTLTGVDTLATAAAMLAQHINSDVTMRRYCRATYSGAVVTIKSRLGWLDLNSPLTHARTAGEEIVRVAGHFDEKNIVDGSFNWPGGGQQEVVNQVLIRFRDATKDFAQRELRVNDRPHQLRTGKVDKYEINGSAVDSLHQAVRIVEAEFAKRREGDFFCTWKGGPGSLPFEEGDVVAVTDYSGGFKNLLVRIESVKINEKREVQFNARLYSTIMFSDEVGQHTIALPTVLPGLATCPQWAVPFGNYIIYYDEGSKRHFSWPKPDVNAAFAVEYELWRVKHSVGFTSPPLLTELIYTGSETIFTYDLGTKAPYTPSGTLTYGLRARDAFGNWSEWVYYDQSLTYTWDNNDATDGSGGSGEALEPTYTLARRLTGAFRGFVRKVGTLWWKVGRQVVDARDYEGWSMNGSADDSAIFQQMVNDGPEGCVLEFPAMTIGLASQVTLKNGQRLIGQGGFGDTPATIIQARTAGQHMLVYDGAPNGRIKGFRFNLHVPGGATNACADSAIYFKASGGEGDYVIEDCFLHNSGVRSTTKLIRVGLNSGLNNENITLRRVQGYGSGDATGNTNTSRGYGVYIDDNPNALGIRLIDCWLRYCNVAFYGGTAGMWSLDRTFFTGNTFDISATGGDAGSVRNCRSENSYHAFKFASTRVAFSSCKWDVSGSLALPSFADQHTRAATHVIETSDDRLLFHNCAFESAAGRDSEITMFRASGGGSPTVMVESFESTWSNLDWQKFGLNANFSLDYKRGGARIVHGIEADQAGVSGALPNIAALRSNGDGTYSAMNLLGYDHWVDVVNFGATGSRIKVWGRLSRLLQFDGVHGMTNFATDDGTILGFDTSSNDFLKFILNRTGGVPDIGFVLKRSGSDGAMEFYNLQSGFDKWRFFGGKMTVNNVIESTSGGFKFPDGTTQTTAASGGGAASVVGTFTWDMSLVTINPGEHVEESFSVSGCNVDDPVACSGPLGLLGGDGSPIVEAYVSDVDTVTIRVTNAHTADASSGSSTEHFTVIVWPQ